MTQAQEHSLIAHQNIGDAFDGIYYVESVFVKKAKNNKDYTEMSLRDKSGSRFVKYWGVVPDLVKGGFVYVAANVEDYMGNPSIIAKNVDMLETPDDLSDYIPVYDDADRFAERFEFIKNTLKVLETTVGDETAGKIVDEVFANPSFFQKFIVAPGSSRSHYGRQGGLLANTVRIAEACVASGNAYGLSGTEKCALISAALLARIGVIDAYEFKDCVPSETKKGILFGVNNLTMTRISSALKRAVTSLNKEGKSVNEDILVRILHAISSLSGIVPMTKEAMLLKSAYCTDSEIVDALDFIENDVNVTEEFTAFDPILRRRYYTGIQA